MIVQMQTRAMDELELLGGGGELDLMGRTGET